MNDDANEIPKQPTEAVTGPGHVQKFFGWLLIALGVVVVLGSGGCGLAMLGSNPGMDQIGMVAVFSGIPMLFGVAMVVAGRNIKNE